MTDSPKVVRDSSAGKVIVVHGDRRAADGVRLGFEREGMPVEAVANVDQALDHLAEACVVIAGAEAAGLGRDLITGLVTAGASRGAPPVLYIGNGVTRAQAISAGATAVLAGPAFVRDVVTIGRILAGRRPGNRSVMDGDLGDSFGVFYLVRALSAIGATGTMLMMRGLRRGEIRFFEGEVTSAQVGGLHGQGALHQLLLWTEARFELRNEPVVRRQQIPMTSDELLDQAERFLIDLRSAAGSLSPAAVYEQDPAVLGAQSRSLPTEVHGVLRLFDGHRTVADALEDSPFRVFETLRVAERAAQVGILRRREAGRSRSTHRAMLALEEWLVGGAGVVAAPAVPEGSGPVGGGKSGKGKKGDRRDRSDRYRAATPEARTHAVVEVDWAALVPRGAGLDTGSLSPVVPSAITAGEINLRTAAAARASRDEGREKLETLTDAQDRDRLFPRVIEPISVDLSGMEREAKEDEEAAWAAAKEKAEAAKVKAEEEAKAAEDAKAAKAKAKAKADEDAKAAKAKADEDAKAKAKADEDAKAKAKADEDAKAKAKADEDAKAKAEEDAKAKAKADEDAKAKADEDAKAKADEDAKAAKAKAKADEDAKAPKAAKAKADEDAKAPSEDEPAPRRSRDRRISGELSTKPAQQAAAAAAAIDAGPSILIDDLVETRVAAATIASAATQASVAPPPTAAVVVAAPITPPRAKELDQVQTDAQAASAAMAVVFTDDEEEFFRAGQAVVAPLPPTDSFADLDDGYQPQSFWDRVLGRKPKPKFRAARVAPAIAKPADPSTKAAAKPATDKPVADKPVADKPVAKADARPTEKPVASKPVARSDAKPGAKSGKPGSSKKR